CGPCRMLAPIVEELSAEMAGRVRVAKLNVDENPATAARFNVRGIPTLLVLKAAQEVDRIVGVQPKSEIARRLQRVLGQSVWIRPINTAVNYAHAVALPAGLGIVGTTFTPR